MTSGNRRLGLALLLACLTATAKGQEKVTERTQEQAAGAKSPQGTLADMAWLAGHWVGPVLGGGAKVEFLMIVWLRFVSMACFLVWAPCEATATSLSSSPSSCCGGGM